MIPPMGIEYPADLATRIGFLLSRAHLLAREGADRVLGELGLTAKGYAALATVISDGPISQRKLSSRIRMDPATMVDVIDELERSGYMQRRRNPDDRREYALVTTARGRALFSRARRALSAAERETVRDLDVEETNTLRELLGRIARKPGSLTTAEMEKNALSAGR